ncbi:hypothetical protein NDU88_004092 [Pleurodeles waltl]|uniref:Uncharacterized protein n=1 Tax=Pleurodeles waltl TaxID=8319 RepID=A0AAV7T7D8_PLEWA|nr:hypothetical protein NDU88_004092 [Pleurodeles waltl]
MKSIFSLSQIPVVTIDRIPKVDQPLPQHLKVACTSAESRPRRSVPVFSSGITPPVCSLTSIDSVAIGFAPQIVNHLVVSPFKQSRGPQKMHRPSPAGQDPGQNMKEDLLQQLEVFRKELMEETTAPREPPPGRLLKARMKPLHPVKIQGPTVGDCRGMLPERLHNRPIQEGLSQLHSQMTRNSSLAHRFPRTPESMHHNSLSSLMEEEPREAAPIR